LLSLTFFLSDWDFDTVGWATGRASGLYKTGCLFVDCGILNGALQRLIAPVVIATSITLCSNKIQKGDILVLANPGPPGKRLLKWTEIE